MGEISSGFGARFDERRVNRGRVSWTLFLFAAATVASAQQQPVSYAAMHVQNGCFVESIACFDTFHDAAGDDAWERVLLWGAREDEVMVAGHAVAVLESDGALWCWDINHGWMRLSVDPSERDNAAVVSVPVLANYPRVTAIYPMLWNDDAQVPEAGPPGGDPSDGAGGSRDAALAATRLARHRPVNLIEISQVENGESRVSDAVVFVFGGRMCIYAPRMGTVTFHARSSVWNVHLVLEMVRRLFPGVEQVRSLTLPAPSS